MRATKLNYFKLKASSLLTHLCHPQTTWLFPLKHVAHLVSHKAGVELDRWLFSMFGLSIELI